MSYSVGPGSSNWNNNPAPGRWPTPIRAAVAYLREYGFKGVLALVAAATLAFTPEALLVWFNHLRFQSLIQLQPGQTVIVRPERKRSEQEAEQAGAAGLLQIICETPTFDGWQPLLRHDDPAGAGASDSVYVRRERVFLRPASDAALPFALLGAPPVSVSLPDGDYEILVVHEAPTEDLMRGVSFRIFPLVSVRERCTVTKHEKTVCYVRLPHYDGGHGRAILLTSADGQPRQQAPTQAELASLAAGIEGLVPIPTPNGYLLSLPEPTVLHDDSHAGCTEDFWSLAAVPREWNRDQLATLRNWLPAKPTPARDKLSRLIDNLGWREFLAGWYCYAAAGVSGLVFTKWGAMAILKPYQRRESFVESLKLLASIYFLSLLAWFLFAILTDTSGCRGPLPFRLR